MSQVRFRAPSPLWDDLAGRSAFRAPAVLRFATDTFVEDFQKVLASDAPGDLAKTVARFETWRTPTAGLPTPSGGPTLKLYQPAQARFYLVSTSLVCRVPGLPEHTVDVANEETVSFVVRRFKTEDDGTLREMAWVTTDDGEGWADAPAAALAKGEERHPMFGTSFEGDDGLPRRLFAGLVPVAKREAYVGGREVKPRKKSEPKPVPPMGPEEPRVVDFQRSVVDPWVGLIDWYEGQTKLATWNASATVRANAQASSEQASAFILLDFAEFLERELNDVWKTIAGTGSPVLETGQLALLAALDAVSIRTRSAGSPISLRAAILRAYQSREGLEDMTLESGTPPPFPAGYAPPRLLSGHPTRPIPGPSSPPGAGDDHLALRKLIDRDPALPIDVEGDPADVAGLNRRRIVNLVMNALAEVPADAEAPPVPAMSPLDAQGEDLFAIRCVYLRPNCGRRSPALVSERTAFFRLASFFDPDAPTRKLRVALPIDTSPATLRKYDRNVAFLLSDELRKQMSRVKDMKKLMDGEADDADLSLGISVICSLSIPIITICALIVLMIMVSLLNIIFWWLPFFITCFPVPSLKAKK